MRSTVLVAAAALFVSGGTADAQPAPEGEKKDAAADAKLTPAAEFTRTKALKAKVGIEARAARLGDVLKEFAAQADMRADALVMWAYGPGFPYAQKVTYSCKDKPIDEALDELFSKSGGLGYVVVSKAGDKRDGWVLLTTTGERGTARPPATEAEEKLAADRLELAKKLIDGGKPGSAKPLLTLVTAKYGNTKAAAEARELLTKLDK
ncbi:MAG TPA: hypothetical protein VGE74_02740 [Gemmata sp.]